MQTTAIPSIRIEPGCRAEVAAVLAEGETLSPFVEALGRASVERRRMQAGPTHAAFARATRRSVRATAPMPMR